jgi:hypothetical protein
MPESNLNKGFNMYYNNAQDRVASHKTGKLSSSDKKFVRDVSREITNRWNNLPESSRDLWNKK